MYDLTEYEEATLRPWSREQLIDFHSQMSFNDDVSVERFIQFIKEGCPPHSTYYEGQDDDSIADGSSASEEQEDSLTDEEHTSHAAQPIDPDTFTKLLGENDNDGGYSNTLDQQSDGNGAAGHLPGLSFLTTDDLRQVTRLSNSLRGITHYLGYYCDCTGVSYTHKHYHLMSSPARGIPGCSYFPGTAL